MNRKLFLLLFLISPLLLMGQSSDLSKYLEGAVPVVNGQVTFEKTYQVPGKSRAEIYVLLKDYTLNQIINGPNHLEQCSFTETDSINGILAASIEENLYFKRKAWVTHYVRFYYQLIYRIDDGNFSVQMRRMYYLYDDDKREEEYRAENWIVDSEALNKKKDGLTRISGKFRKYTIDRKDEIFKGAAKSVGVTPSKKIIIVDEE